MGFTHFDEDGNAIMVDVSDKEITKRTAYARGTIQVNHEIIEHIKSNTVEKGMFLVWQELQVLWLQKDK